MSNKEIHNHNTRNSLQLHKKGNRTNYRKLTLPSKGTEVWNNLPKQYKEPRSYDFFKLMLKQDAYHRRKHESRIRTSTALIPREINMRELKHNSQHFS